MDSSTSRKRQRDQANSDDEDGPRKQPATSSATPAHSSESAVHSPYSRLKSPDATERAGLEDDPETATSPIETQATDVRLSIEQLNAQQPTPGAAAAFLKDVPARGTPTSLRKKERKTAPKQQTPAAPMCTSVIHFPPGHRAAPAGFATSVRPLAQRPAVPQMPGGLFKRVNHRHNLVVAVANTSEGLEGLLAISELQGILVVVKEPADHRKSSGYLHSVDGYPEVETLLLGLLFMIPVLSAASEGRRVPLRPRAIECGQCGRFGNVKECCSWPEGCIGCGRTNPGYKTAHRHGCGVSTVVTLMLPTRHSGPGGRSSRR
ncbi:hypothetical protein MRX96_000794 [Rhipicephalus microplus]